MVGRFVVGGLSWVVGGGRVSAVDHLKIAREVGAHVTLAKPFTYAELVAAVQAAL
jgi:DNA-binding response OmpR family regulator